jgi:WD40 repeat protein
MFLISRLKLIFVLAALVLSSTVTVTPAMADHQPCDFLADTMTMGFPNVVQDLAYDSTGKFLASLHRHAALCVWNVSEPSEEPLARFTRNASITVNWIQEDTSLVYVQSNKSLSSVVTLDAASAQIQQMLVSQNSYNSSDYNVDQNLLVVAGRAFNERDTTFFERVIFYDPISGRDAANSFSFPPRTEPYGNYIQELSLNSSADKIAFATREGLILTDMSGNRQDICPTAQEWENNWAYTVDWHPDGNALLTGLGDESSGQLLLWRLEEDCVTLDETSQDDLPRRVRIVEFSPDGNWFVTSDDETLAVWSYATMEIVDSAPIKRVSAVAWHPAGDQIAVGTTDSELMLIEFTDESLGDPMILLEAEE